MRKATQALTARRVPGGPLLIHKLVEARYRHHEELQESARRHSGLPPLRPPPLVRGPAPARPMDVIDAALDVEDSVPRGVPLPLDEARQLLEAAEDRGTSESVTGTPVPTEA